MAWHCSGLYSAHLSVTFNLVVFIRQHEGELLFLHLLQHHLCVVGLLFLLIFSSLIPSVSYCLHLVHFNILLLFLLFYKFLIAVLLFFLLLIILL
jgi:hypothetical protein